MHLTLVCPLWSVLAVYDLAALQLFEALVCTAAMTHSAVTHGVCSTNVCVRLELSHHIYVYATAGWKSYSHSTQSLSSFGTSLCCVIARVSDRYFVPIFSLLFYFTD